ncbi:MAG TPA: hypothetical protein VI755_11100 [Anaerolineales bacterium]|nr:hypothetical protein [Anaerolineales bacterium]
MSNIRTYRSAAGALAGGAAFGVVGLGVIALVENMGGGSRPGG